MRPSTRRRTRPLTSLVTGVFTPLVKFGQRSFGLCHSTSSTSTAISTLYSLLHPSRMEPYQRATSTGLLSTPAPVKENPSYPSTVTPSLSSKSHPLLLDDHDLTVRNQARFERDETSAMSPLVLRCSRCHHSSRPDPYWRRELLRFVERLLREGTWT